MESFQFVAACTLRVRFHDKTEQLAGELYGPLRNLELFKQVRIDPATLHDWPENEAAFKELAHRWESVRAD
ncbi:MAG TPA: hypothetical protein VKX39_10490 [Bryobacteraceae bacterium]|nr:hypothetical protein [Bryobacteraceae bacterium]